MDTFWILVGLGTPSMAEFVRKTEGYSEPNSGRALRAIWDPYLYDPSLWDKGTPPPCWQSLGSSYLLQSQRALHAFRSISYLPAATAMISRGWRSLVPPQGFGTLQNSPSPDVPDPSENMASLMEGPHLPISPFLKNQGFSLESVRHSESLDTMKPEKGLAAIPRPLMLGSCNKRATFLPVCLLRGGGKFFLQIYVQWDTGHPKLFLMFLE